MTGAGANACQDARPMAEQVRMFDWAGTPLGPSSAWPQSLRTMLSVVLNARSPMCLAWGDDLTCLYNDPYRSLLGDKPETLGRPFAEVWADAWPGVAEIMARARAGEASSFDEFAATLERHGRPVKTWWTFSVSPVVGEAGEVSGVLCSVHETTGEVNARATLDAERERLARLFEQAPGFIALLRGPDHIYDLVNAAHRRLTPGREVLGRPAREAFPELGRDYFELLDEVYRSGRPRNHTGLRIPLAAANAALRDRYVDVTYQPITAEDGSVTGIFVEGHDVTERVAAEAAVNDREDRLKLAIDAGRMATWDFDPASGAVTLSAGALTMLGLPPGRPVSTAGLQAGFLPGEFERVTAALDEARRRQDPFFEVEYRHVRPDDGEIRWFLARGRIEFAPTDTPARSFGVLMDLTDRKAAEDRLHLLAREVDHRANNLLAAVQSVVNLTRAEDVPGFRTRIVGRIRALANAHRLLAASRWTGAALAQVVAEELEPYREGDVRIEGPDARLAPPVAQALAIALHELATNAAKYGSLSTPNGRTRVTWSALDEKRRIHMTWQESGGAPPSPSPRAGFGMTLLQRAFAGQPGGSVELDWRPEGLFCRLSFPAL